MSARTWTAAAVGIAVAAAIAALAVADGPPALERLRACAGWLAAGGPLAVVGFVCAFALWGLVLPKAPLVALSGLAFGLGPGLAIAYLGATGAIAGGFWCSRAFRPRLRAWLARHPRLDACDRALAARGWSVVVLLRLSPLIPFHVQNYAYGASRLSFVPCLAASWLGLLPSTALCVAAGAAARPDAAFVPAGPLGWQLAALGVAAAVAAAWLLAATARRQLAGMMVPLEVPAAAVAA